MKILFIVPYVPNLVRVRPYNLVHFLVRRGNDVTLATLWSNEAEYADLQGLKSSCSQILSDRLSTARSMFNAASALPGKLPLQSMYCWHPGLARRLEELVASSKPSFDVIHVEHLRGVRYGLRLARSHANGRTPVVWDSVDSISHLFRQASSQTVSLKSRLVTALELKRTEQYERWLMGQFPRILVTSPVDRQAFVATAPTDLARRVTILPNGVDLDYFCPPQPTTREPATLVVSGKMSYHANVTMVVHLVNEILPAVWAKRPDVKIWIVGKDPAPEICALAALPGVVVTGTVPDVRPYLQSATLAVAPVTYGAGIQNKVLEAMACGTPVISSSQAVSALSAMPGRDLMVAHDTDDFSKLILSMLDNPQQCAAVGHAGRAYVEQAHHWERITADLEQIYLAAGQAIV